MIPGEMFIKDGEIELNKGRKTVTLSVSNAGDRPIQVGSHYHFFETNPALKFERKKARGMRLDIAAGTAVRFEPGQTREVDAGRAGRKAHGLRVSRRCDGEIVMGVTAAGNNTVPKSHDGRTVVRPSQALGSIPGARVSARREYQPTGSPGRRSWTTTAASSIHVPCPLRPWRPSVSGAAEDG